MFQPSIGSLTSALGPLASPLHQPSAFWLNHRTIVKSTLPQMLTAAATAAPAAAIARTLSSGVTALAGVHLLVGAARLSAAEVRRDLSSVSGSSGARPTAVSVGGPGGRGGFKTAEGWVAGG